MDSTPAPTASTPSTKRRMILAGLGLGAAGAVAGWVRWPWSGSAVPVAAAPVPKAGDSAKTSGAIEAPTPEASPVADAPAGAWSRERFVPYVNTPFQLDDIPVKLAEVGQASTRGDRKASYTAYSLFFDGPAADAPESRIYQVRHAELGEMELFLSPIGRNPKATRYEAAITRRI